MTLQANLPTPYRLAVFFKQEDFPSRPALQRVDWVSTDADRVQRALAPVQEEGILQQSFPDKSVELYFGGQAHAQYIVSVE